MSEAFDPRARVLPEERRQFWPHRNGISALPFPLPRAPDAYFCGICGKAFKSDGALYAHLSKSTLTSCVPTRTRRATQKGAR